MATTGRPHRLVAAAAATLALALSLALDVAPGHTASRTADAHSVMVSTQTHFGRGCTAARELRLAGPPLPRAARDSRLLRRSAHRARSERPPRHPLLPFRRRRGRGRRHARLRDDHRHRRRRVCAPGCRLGTGRARHHLQLLACGAGRALGNPRRGLRDDRRTRREALGARALRGAARRPLPQPAAAGAMGPTSIAPRPK